MKYRFSAFSHPGRLSIFLKLALPIIIFCVLAGAGMIPRIAASASSSPSSGIVRHQDLRPLAGDTCAAATVVNPAALPFFEDSTTVGAANNIDPGASSCAPGPGGDVVYSFTPTATDQYTVAATPLQNTFDLSLYIITDCANP